METFVLNNISYEPDLDKLRADHHVKPGSKPDAELERLVVEARAIAKPEGLYGLAFIDSEDKKTIVVEGITFKSRVLRVNIGSHSRIFPYVVTGGVELDRWAKSRQGILQRYLAETIAEQAVGAADDALEDHMQERYGTGTLSVMNPGSLPDWPISEQIPLFSLLGDTEEAIGVTLSESMMMLPVKSVSGIRFASDQSFFSCQLCPREGCRARRKPHEPELYEKHYSMKPPQPT
jgi:hypothetical protein